MIPTRTGTTIKNESKINSTTNKLKAKEIFLPEIGDDLLMYNTIRVDVKSNVNSIIDGVELQQSDNNITWFTYKKCSYLPTIKCIVFDIIRRKYFRVKYTNGDYDQKIFRIKTVFQQNIISLDNQIIQISPLHSDTYGNLKTSSDIWETAINIKHIIKEDTILALSTASTGANIVYNNNINALKLSVSNNNNKCISQSRNNIMLSSGYRTKIYITCVIDANNNSNDDNVISRVGVFDDKDGIFYEYNGLTNIKLCIRQNYINTYINKSDWNIDTLDGGGTSNIHFNEFTINTFVFEFNWNGISDAYAGILSEGIIHMTHIFKSFNIETNLLLTTCNLPIKCELEANTNTYNNGSMYIYSMYSYIKDKFIPKGDLFSLTNASYDEDIDYGMILSDEYDYVLFALRHNLTKNGSFIPLNLSISCVDSSDRIMYKIILYKTLDESVNNLILNHDNHADILNYDAINNDSYLEKFIPNSSQIIIINELYDSYKTILYQGIFSTFVDIDLKKIYEASRYFNIIKATGYNNGILTNMRDHLIVTCKHIGSDGETRGHYAFNWLELS